MRVFSDANTSKLKQVLVDRSSKMEKLQKHKTSPDNAILDKIFGRIDKNNKGYIIESDVIEFLEKTSHNVKNDEPKRIAQEIFKVMTLWCYNTTKQKNIFLFVFYFFVKRCYVTTVCVCVCVNVCVCFVFIHVIFAVFFGCIFFF